MSEYVSITAVQGKSVLSSEDQNGPPAMVIPTKMEEAKAGDPSTMVRIESGQGAEIE
jgi:hypothetical protein